MTSHLGTQPRPFRFGVAATRPLTGPDLVETARVAEGLGYDVISFPDRLSTPPPIPAVMMAAEVTERITVGTLVIDTSRWHPVDLARHAAAIDLWTDGRLELGLGSGAQRGPNERAGGLAERSAAERVDHLAEMVPTVRALLDGHDVGGYRLTPEPRRPRPPILIGAGGPRALALAAREADIVSLSGALVAAGPSVVDKGVALVADEARKRPVPPELHIPLSAVAVTDDRDRELVRLSEQFPDLGPADLAASPHLLIGTIDQIVDDLQARRASHGITAYSVAEPAMMAMSPILERLVGGAGSEHR